METNYKITILGNYQIYINTEPLNESSINFIKSHPLNCTILNNSFKGVINKYDKDYQISILSDHEKINRFSKTKLFNLEMIRYNVTFWFYIKKYNHRMVNVLFSHDLKRIQIEAENREYYDFLINYEFCNEYLTVLSENIKSSDSNYETRR
jgi:hypothetical protein